jgi:molecular chaperone DnaK
MGKTLGIDLGTTNSAAAYIDEDGDPEIIENAEGEMTTPSVIQIQEEGETLIGETAVNLARTRASRTVERVKRDMGTDKEYDIGDETFRPEDVSALILQKLKIDAEDYLGEDVDNAVITVPYYFGSAEREATRDAGQIAGLSVRRIINEPTAACVRYGFKQEEADRFIFVYDLGGGTFDATLVDTGESSVDVIATEGNEELGGENFDDKLYEQIREEFIEAGNPDPDQDRNLEFNVRDTVKTAKEDLSNGSSTMISLLIGEEPFERELTREEFNDFTGDLVDQTIDHIDELFAKESVYVEPEDIDDIILVGGSTRIPLVQERVEDYFGEEPSQDVSTDTIVAQGAAMVGDMSDEKGQVYDVLSHSLGVMVAEKVDEKDERVEKFDPILKKNDKVPSYNDKENYTTFSDNQTEIAIHILQGESELAEECDELGVFTLSGIEPRPAGEPRFAIRFTVNKEGRLSAEVKEADTGNEEDFTLDDTIGLEREEIESRIEKLNEKGIAYSGRA